jgi:hypothetical protein
MNWKIILVMLVVCLGLGTYVYLEMAPDSSRIPRRKQEVEYLMSFDQDRVDRLKIVFLDTLYEVKRRGSQWEMLRPLAGTFADSGVVNHLCRTMTRIPVFRSIPIDSVNLAQLYLEDPAISFTFYFDGGDSSKVGFGLLNPTTQNIYVRKDRLDRVLLIGKEVGPMLYVGFDLLRSKQLISLSPYRVKHIGLGSRQGWESILDRDSETGVWSVRRGKTSARADKRRILNLLFTLYTNPVREFLEQDATDIVRTGLTRPVRRLLVVGEQNDSMTVSIGDPQRGREYLRWASSSIYPENLLLVDFNLVELLDELKLESIRDLHITDFDRSGLSRIELAYATETIVLAADNDTLWGIVEPEESPCRLWQVERLLTHCDTMQAHKIIPPGRGQGFDRPQLRISISADSEEVVSLLVGDYKGDSLYMRDQLRGIDFLAPSHELERLTYSLEDLADVAVQHVVE